MRLRLVAFLTMTLTVLFLYQNCGQGLSKGSETLSSFTFTITDGNGGYRLPEEIEIDPSLDPTVYLRNAETSAGEDANFEILLNKTLSVMVQVEVETFDGSAISGVHFEPTRKTLQIAPGQTAIIFPVPTLGSAELLEPVIFGARIVEASIPIGQDVSGGLIQNLQSPLNFTKIKAGTFHACGLDLENKAWCWGYNRSSQLGLESSTSQVIPTPVPGGNSYSDIFVNHDNSCGLREDGVLECWGGNVSGQLGNGSFENSEIPVTPTGLPAVKTVAVGYRAVCAVTLTDQLYCWGNNSNQLLGLNSTQASFATPQLVRSNIESVSLGFHGCATSTTDQLFCWGINTANRLARVTTTQVVPTPALVPGMPNAKKVHVANGTTCVLTLTDELRCVGRDLEAHISSPAYNQTSSSFYSIDGLGTVADFSISTSHGCALTQTGELSCWGSNANGELGRVTPTGNFDANSEDIGSVTNLMSFSTGSFFTCIVSGDSEGRCWGSNSFSRLGNNPASNSLTARTSSFSQVTKMAQSFSRACIINSKKEVQCIVESGPGSDGDSGAVSYVNLTTVPGLGTVKDLSVGSLHACAVRTAGDVYCWGYGSAGQLGSGTATSNTPIQVPGLTGVETIYSNSGGRNCAILQDQSVSCWGNYSSIGSSVPGGIQPQTVPGFQGATKMAMGSNHTCALIQGGSVRCVGSNNEGQLGNGLVDTAFSATPTTVLGSDVFVDISAGANFTCGLVSGGKAKCWGANDRGQLGQNMSNEDPNPQPLRSVANLSAIRKIYSGPAHSCVVVEGNRPFCWGDNTGWRTGILTGGIAEAPIAVTSVYNVRDIALSSNRSFYVKTDGSVRVAGSRPSSVNSLPKTPISIPNF